MFGIKQAFLDYKKGHSKKLEKLAFSQRGLPTILVKHLEFLGCVFFYRTCLYILFDKVLEKKQALLELKNVVLQKSKNLHFRQKVTFRQKFEIYCMCNFHRIGQ